MISKQHIKNETNKIEIFIRMNIGQNWMQWIEQKTEENWLDKNWTKWIGQKIIGQIEKWRKLFGQS